MAAGSDPVEPAAAPGAGFVRLTGTGTTWWDKLQRLSPGTVRRLSDNLAAALARDALAPKLREFIYIGVDALVTHLYPTGLAVHVENALKHGARVDEIIEVLQIASAVSSNGYGKATAVLADVLAEAGINPPEPIAIADEAEFRERFEAKAGFWAPWIKVGMAHSPHYLRSLLEVGYSPGEASAIGLKDRALISMALAASPPIADEAAVRSFAAMALKSGATATELYEAVQMTAALGGHAFSIGAPILARTLEERDAGHS